MTVIPASLVAVAASRLKPASSCAIEKVLRALGKDGSLQAAISLHGSKRAVANLPPFGETMRQVAMERWRSLRGFSNGGTMGKSRWGTTRSIAEGHRCWYE